MRDAPVCFLSSSYNKMPRGPKARPRRRQMKKRQYMPRRKPRGTSQSTVHHYVRSYYLAATVSNTGVSSGYGYSFSLAALPNASEFTTLYDQYRIKQVKFKLLPRGNSSDVGTQNNLGSLFSVIDRDDAAAPGNINTLLQYQNMKQTRSSQSHTRIFRLTFNTSALDSAGVPLGNKVTTGWIDCASSTVPHYGLKLWNEVSTANTVVYDAIVTVAIDFKNVR